MKKIGFLMQMLSVVLLLSAIALGQETTGGIEGTVKDANGAVVPNVTVEITTASQTATETTTTGTGAGFRRTVTTDDEGFFRALQIPPGVYNVVTTATSGFAEARYENVTVAIGRNTQLTITVNPGTTTTTVDVAVSDAPPVDTTSSSIQTSVNAQKIELLPKGTGFTSLLKTIPGTRPESRTGGFSVDGASGGENVFVIDGQEVTNFRTGTLNENNNVPTQFVQEVQVKSSGFGAEFGGATGGVISVVSKGGTNDFHGETGIQFEVPKFNGNPRPSQQRFTSGSGLGFVQEVTYFNPPKSQGTNVFPTANLGGPIIKQRLWFFGSYSPQVFDTITTTQFYNSALSATRQLQATETFRRKRTYEYAFGRLDASPFESLRLTGTFLWNPIVDRGNVPFGTLSFGGAGSIPSADFGPGIGVLSGRQLTDKQGGRQNSNLFTTQAAYTPTSKLVFTGRFSRGFLNQKLGNYFVPQGLQIVCSVGNQPTSPTAPVYPGACEQGVTTASNAEITRDVSVRTNIEFDGSYLVSFGGQHELKAGYQRFKIFNDVASFGTTKGRITFSYNRQINQLGAGVVVPSGPLCTPGTTMPAGCVLGAGVYRFSGTFGTAENLNQSIYVQDKYQPIRRLTLNLGVRFEKEFLPSFNEYAPPINFGWSDKIAPRLGFAFDLFGDGTTKIFGSYGQFYDRMKFELPRGLFGGDVFLETFFEILPGQSYTFFNAANILGSFSGASVCQPTGFIAPDALGRCQLDRRVAANEPGASPYANGAVDTNLKPFRQSEYTVGMERQIGRNYVLRARYTHKNVDEVIEDAGIRNAQDSEAYIIGNPGSGLHRELLETLGYNRIVDPKRVYDGFEVVFEKRLSNNWYFHANYTLSRLYGNYSGLVSSDEAHLTSGRTSPNVTRAFDLPFIGFTATGELDDGPLQTDRPHVFNMYGAYIFDWKGGSNSTEFSAFQTIASGTPQTTTAFFVSSITPQLIYGRNDLGRTPTFSQTDFNITHRYRFGSDNRFTVAFDLNLLNLFDQATVTGLYTTMNPSNRVINFATFNPPNFPGPPRFTNNGPAFVNAYTSGALANDLQTYLDGAADRRDLRYGRPFLFQSPREVRFGVRVLF